MKVETTTKFIRKIYIYIYQNLKPGSHEKEFHLKEQTNFQTNAIPDFSINYLIWVDKWLE